MLPSQADPQHSSPSPQPCKYLANCNLNWIVVSSCEVQTCESFTYRNNCIQYHVTFWIHSCISSSTSLYILNTHMYSVNMERHLYLRKQSFVSVSLLDKRVHAIKIKIHMKHVVYHILIWHQSKQMIQCIKVYVIQKDVFLCQVWIACL
jgi:hypothetical protein